jgi:hypothetical protein
LEIDRIVTPLGPYPPAGRRSAPVLRDGWLREHPEAKREHPSFSDFRTWLEARYTGVFYFRSTMGPLYDAEMWFDRELGQSWRN